MAVMTAGAYGAVMSSTYNTRPLVPEVLVNGADYAVVRPRPEVLISADRAVVRRRVSAEAIDRPGPRARLARVGRTRAVDDQSLILVRDRAALPAVMFRLSSS